jgi:hypothetical protein
MAFNNSTRSATSYEAQIFELLAKGVASDDVLSVLLPDNRALAYESDLWDYKLGFHKAKVEGEDEVEYSLCGIIKDIVSFYNTFGGYLLVSLPKQGSSFRSLLLDYDTIQKKIEKYTGRRIITRYHRKDCVVEGEELDLLLIQVPKRPVDDEACLFKKPSPASRNGKKQFELNNICARRGSECVVANNDPTLLQFIVGERPYLFIGQSFTVSECDHNLPSRDPNVLQFVGRQEYLKRLWTWLADTRDPIRLLTAIGGTGKTSIAYEFCEQLIQSGQSFFDKIIWMTGKSQAYAAILGRHVSTTRTDFTNLDTFLRSVLLELAMTQEDIDQLPSLQEKEEYLYLMVRDAKIFLVIDDVDSLDLGQQQELYALVSRVFYQAIGAGGRSKCLLTSRLELYAGAKEIIRVQGFPVNEALEYAGVTALYLDLSEPQAQHIRSNFGMLYSASQGSPIFIASLLRLYSLGDELSSIIKDWKGKEGEAVRRFTFAREIDALAYSAKRTLFAMQLMAETNFDELREMLEVDRRSLRSDLGHLRQFHLFIGSDDPATGSTLTIPEPIRLMFEVTEDCLQKEDATDIKKRAAQKSGLTPHVDPVRTEMRRIAQLTAARRHDDAEVVARGAVKRFAKNGDVCCVLAKLLVKKKPPQYEEADKYFNEARMKKCTRPELLHHWVNTKYRIGDEEGLLQITESNSSAECRGVPNVYRLIVLYRRARNAENRKDLVEAISQYKAVVEEGSKILREGRADATYMIISKLINGCGNYAVNTSISLHGMSRNSLQTAELCVDLMRMGVWSSYIAITFVRSFAVWWDAVDGGFKNDATAVKAARRLVTNSSKFMARLGLTDDETDQNGEMSHFQHVKHHNNTISRRINDYVRTRGLKEAVSSH